MRELRIRQSSLRLISMYRKRPVVRMYVTVALTFLTITFFAGFAIRPTAITIFGLIKELNAKRELSATLDTKIASLFGAQSTYADAFPSLGILDEALPQSPTLPNFLNQLRSLAATRQVTLRSVSIEPFELLGKPMANANKAKDPTVPEQPQVSYPFTLTVVGPYSSLYGFLSDLESLRRVVTVKGLGFTQSQDEEGVSTLSLSVGGSVSAMAPPSLGTENK